VSTTTQPPLRILAICASLQEKSQNRTLIEAAVRLAPGGAVVVPYFGLADLPHFNPDLEAGGTPAAVAAYRQAIRDSDALLIACPEYGHSLPGVLKNSIDWLIGSGELEGKLVAITASTNMAGRGRLGLRALRDALVPVQADVLGGEPIVRGPESDAQLAELLRALLARHRLRTQPRGDRPAPSYRIATLDADDAPAYNEFLRRGILAHPDTLRIAEADVLATPFATADTADGATLVACDDDGRWLGVVTVQRESDRQKRQHIAWIYRMYVAAEFAGAGVGRSLLTAALGRARAIPGVSKVNLTVAAHNLGAIRLYTSAGFREFARENDAFRSPAKQTEVSMSLSLDW
jgi:NAD(P)H-dependent FMN reductase/ribosomal protein S18 acetylase RimI-like enzyme